MLMSHSKRDYTAIAQRVKSGEITFQQYIDLRAAYATLVEGKDWSFVCAIIKILTGEELKMAKVNSALVQFIEEVTQAMKNWQDLEARYLNYKPSAQERQAGIEQLSKEIGWIGTAKSLAKTYACDVDTVLDCWQWAKVFELLRTDLLEYEYAKRLNKIMTK